MTHLRGQQNKPQIFSVIRWIFLYLIGQNNTFVKDLL